LKKRLPIGWSTSVETLKREFCHSNKMPKFVNFDEFALQKALYILEKMDTIQFRHQGKSVFRSGL